MTPEIREKLHRLRQPRSVGAWILLVFGILWSVVAAWGDAEFLRDKLPWLLSFFQDVNYVLSDIPAWLVLVVGFAWLTAVVLWRGKTSSPVFTPPHGPPLESERLGQTKRILLEAADALKEYRGRPKSIDQAAEEMRPYLSATQFLSAAFEFHVRRDFNDWYRAEHDKFEDARVAFELLYQTGLYFERLAARIREDELDEGFVMPNSWRQFNASDNWPANRRQGSSGGN